MESSALHLNDIFPGEVHDPAIAVRVSMIHEDFAVVTKISVGFQIHQQCMQVLHARDVSHNLTYKPRS